MPVEATGGSRVPLARLAGDGSRSLIGTVLLAAYGISWFPAWTTFGPHHLILISWVLLAGGFVSGAAVSWAELSLKRLIIVALGAEAIGSAVLVLWRGTGLLPAPPLSLGLFAVMAAFLVFWPVMAAAYLTNELTGAIAGELRWPGAVSRAGLAVSVTLDLLASEGLLKPSIGLVGLGLFAVSLIASGLTRRP